MGPMPRACRQAGSSLRPASCPSILPPALSLRALRRRRSGVDMSHVIKTTVFLKDMNDFAAMNGVYATFFGEGGFPARSAVEVARLPKDALVEIEVIAVP